MAWAFVTGSAKSGALSTSNSQTVTFGQNTTAGNRAFLMIDAWQSTATNLSITSVSDAKNGTWHKDNEQVYNDGTFLGIVSLWSVQLASALLTTDNITIAFASSPGVGGGRYGLDEYSGLSTAANPVDVSAQDHTSAGTRTNPSATTANTTGANELVRTDFGDDGYTTTFTVPPAGTNRILVQNDSTADLWIGDKDSGTSGSAITQSGTCGSSAWAFLVTVYKLAGAAAVAPVSYGLQLKQAVKRAAYY